MEGQQATQPAGQHEKVSGKKVALILLVIVLILLLLAGTAIGIYAWRFASAYQDITIGPVDIEQLPDGVYFGTWSVFHVEVSVSVAVKDHQIVAIDVLDAGSKGNGGEGKENLDTLIGRIIEGQDIQVDTVSGATATQKVFLKSVEEALTHED